MSISKKQVAFSFLVGTLFLGLGFAHADSACKLQKPQLSDQDVVIQRWLNEFSGRLWPLSNPSFSRDKVLRKNDGSPDSRVDTAGVKDVSEGFERSGFSQLKDAEEDLFCVVKSLGEQVKAYEESLKGDVLDTSNYFDDVVHYFKDKNGNQLRGGYDAPRITFVFRDGLVESGKDSPSIAGMRVITTYEKAPDGKLMRIFTWSLSLKYQVKTKQVSEKYGYHSERREFLDGREVVEN